MSERAKEFLEEDYFHLTINCSPIEIPYIIMALQEYADQEVERYKREHLKPTNDE
tara:strand:- start:574 stop:738 length:165 start_codon:yes stop_codon:yes gene_type:complete